MGSAVSCGTVHGKTALSLFTAIASALLCLSTIAINALILIGIRRNKRKAMSGIFYSILFSISLGDLLTGLITDVVSVVFHLKEALSINISLFEIRLLHMSLFIINGASVLSMALLSIDRIFAIMWPFQYRDGIKDWKKILSIASTWIVSILITLAYLEFGYIKHLAVFACTTVILALTLMVTTFWLYHSKLIRKPIKPTAIAKCPADDSAEKDKAGTNSQSGDGKLAPSGRAVSQVVKPVGLSERRVTMSFIIMLFVFAASYLPTCIMIIYMNACVECDCILIHSMRDLTFLFILSSALLRAMNFLFRLSPIRRSVMTIVNGNTRSCNEPTVSAQ